MYSYRIHFYTLNSDIAFIMKSPKESEVKDFANDIISIFTTLDNNHKQELNSLQKYSEDIKNNISNFISKYCVKLPQLNGLLAFFKKLKLDEYFIFIPNTELEQIEWIKLKEYLTKIIEGEKYIQPSETLLDRYNDLLNNYNVNLVGHQRLFIGEKDKKKRVCRFCYKNSNSTTFNNKAHAISEALGNKTVILFDECDRCNKMFSETIEPDIIEFLSIYRTIFGVKGKGGNKKIKGKNFSLENNGEVNLTFNSLTDRPNPDSKDYKLNLHQQNPIILQNIYKSFCKYFLSVIDEENLIYFKETIEWIKGKLEINSLPKIAELTTYDFFTHQPKLTYYKRKNQRTNLPFAICEFRFTCKIYVYIIPLSNQDNKDFIKDIDFQYYWKTLKHYDQFKTWSFDNYSNNTPKAFSVNLDFKINQKTKTS